MQQLEFNWKYKDYELRACPRRLARLEDDESNETIDFVKWYDYHGKRACYSLAYWQETSEGYDLKFVGDRPFRDIEIEDLSTIWTALHLAQKVLDGWFKLKNID
jgi:hypothetical protein